MIQVSTTQIKITINLRQRRQEYTLEKRQSLLQVVLGELDGCMEMNEIRTISNTI